MDRTHQRSIFSSLTHACITKISSFLWQACGEFVVFKPCDSSLRYRPSVYMCLGRHRRVYMPILSVSQRTKKNTCLKSLWSQYIYLFAEKNIYFSGVYYFLFTVSPTKGENMSERRRWLQKINACGPVHSNQADFSQPHPI